MKKPGEIGAQPEVRVRSDPGEDEQQRRWMILTIQGDADSVASIESRQLPPASEYRHMDRLTLEARRHAIGI